MNKVIKNTIMGISLAVLAACGMEGLDATDSLKNGNYVPLTAEESLERGLNLDGNGKFRNSKTNELIKINSEALINWGLEGEYEGLSWMKISNNLRSVELGMDLVPKVSKMSLEDLESDSLSIDDLKITDDSGIFGYNVKYEKIAGDFSVSDFSYSGFSDDTGKFEVKQHRLHTNESSAYDQGMRVFYMGKDIVLVSIDSINPATNVKTLNGTYYKLVENSEFAKMKKTLSEKVNAAKVKADTIIEKMISMAADNAETEEEQDKVVDEKSPEVAAAPKISETSNSELKDSRISDETSEISSDKVSDELGVGKSEDTENEQL